ncbi:MAG TPA: toll/interleukin-1 receptor domain-containing protein, partial [Roseiflexaceae bacterium]
MRSDPIFISHASKDDEFVKELRQALEGQGLSVWVDSRNLRGGAKLAPEIEQAIEQARQVIVVLSPNTQNSPWVRKEIQQALQVEQRRKDDGYRVIPLLLPGVEPSALALWFDEEPVGVRVQLTVGGLSEALPAILAALGERLPDDRQPPQAAAPQPVEELLLKLSDVGIRTRGACRRAIATAVLVYEPADSTAREVESPAFPFVAPLGPIEAEELRWYLENFFLWPTGVFQERAARVEAQLPQWGQELYQAALDTEEAREVLTAWQKVTDGAERRFSVQVYGKPPQRGRKKQSISGEAASTLLALPWELLHDGRGYLFQG